MQTHNRGRRGSTVRQGEEPRVSSSPRSQEELRRQVQCDIRYLGCTIGDGANTAAASAGAQEVVSEIRSRAR